MEKPKTRAYISTKIYNTLENTTDEIESQKMCKYMARMSNNVESTRINYGDSLKLTNWILDSDETCHMTPEISDFILGLLVETDKYIKVEYGNFVTAKQTEKFQIKCMTIMENPLLIPYTTYY